MVSGSVEGDSVTINSLSDGVAYGALLATRPLQAGEVTSTNTIVSVNLTLGTNMGQLLFGLVDSSNNTIAQEIVESSGTVELNPLGYDLTTCKLAIWYNNPAPYEVTINSVIGIDSTPYWSVNNLAVTDSSQNDGAITIQSVGDNVVDTLLASHTIIIEGSPTGVTAEFTVAGGNPFGSINTTTQIQLLVDEVVVATGTFEESSTITLTAALSSAVAVKYAIVGGSDTSSMVPFQITAVSTNFTF